MSAHDEHAPTRDEIIRATRPAAPARALHRVPGTRGDRGAGLHHRRLHRIGTRSRLAGVPRQLDVLRHHLAGRRHLRRSAAHHDRAVVAPDRALPRRVRRLPADRVRAAHHRLPRRQAHLSVGHAGDPGEREALLPESHVSHHARPAAFRRAGVDEPLVHLPVRAPRRGGAPRVGCRVGARDSRAHAPQLPRRAPRDPLDAFDAGEARRLDVPGLRLLLFGARLGSLDVARPPLQQHALLVVVVHGRMAGRAHELVAALHVVAPLPQRVRAHQGSEVPRSRKALLRLHGVLGILHLRAVSRELVREPRRGNALAAASPHRSRICRSGSRWCS